MTLGFLILMLNACWNNLWCYKDIWGSFKKNKDNFLFFWVKLKVAFRNTIFWSWVWALIYTNHFCNMELIECKAYSASICISIPFSNVGRFFQKISITKSWTELLRQNRRSIFQWKNPSPPNQCCSQRFRLLATKLGQIQHWYGGVRGRICNLKNWVIYWIYWIFNFVSTSFVQGCRKNFRNNKHKFTKYGRFMIMEQLQSVETASTKIFKLKLIKRETF